MSSVRVRLRKHGAKRGHGTPAGHAHIKGGSFLCPECQGKTQVYDSRPQEGGIRRRRSCTECGHRIRTFESESDISPNAADKRIRLVVRALREFADQLEALGEPE